MRLCFHVVSSPHRLPPFASLSSHFTTPIALMALYRGIAPRRRASSRPGIRILSDVLGRDKSINIFAGFTRDVESISQRLDDPTQNSTVLAPLNSAIENLPRKLWEDPKDYDSLGAEAYEGDDGMERARYNLRRFAEAHIVPVSPWAEKEKVKPVGSDAEIWWEAKGGVKVV